MVSSDLCSISYVDVGGRLKQIGNDQISGQHMVMAAEAPSERISACRNSCEKVVITRQMRRGAQAWL